MVETKTASISYDPIRNRRKEEINTAADFLYFEAKNSPLEVLERAVDIAYRAIVALKQKELSDVRPSPNTSG